MHAISTCQIAINLFQISEADFIAVLTFNLF